MNFGIINQLHVCFEIGGGGVRVLNTCYTARWQKWVKFCDFQCIFPI